ncbi:oxalate decarboxylase [Colletotrichum scovillei]|uniref:Oxalate decarboxylase n=1 Tax=Colletotrichum scovillei TaxID=1209932 RepID=A0A9P7UJ03_9PEZI|nr:oxalate decarboxylase [Colletotrichum scovillei]KAG7074626.1 oxalate decarboxylase [Colletotrichum scovillei]KAG7081686.1 oxalate decarboxylase [Colletotrichum scovillei]
MLIEPWIANRSNRVYHADQMRICFSCLRLLTNSSGTLRVCATTSGGVRASHWVKEMSTTLSDLYSSIHTKSSVSEVFSM